VAPRQIWAGAEILVPPQGFDPLIVQPLASRYTDYAISVHVEGYVIDK